MHSSNIVDNKENVIFSGAFCSSVFFSWAKISFFPEERKAFHCQILDVGGKRVSMPLI
jgi:hypothetical protein